MGWPGKNQDPFDARTKALSDQIRQLERQIRELSQQTPPAAPTRPPRPKPRPDPAPSTPARDKAIPHVATARSHASPASTPHTPAANPVPAPHTPTKLSADARINPNGIRKFDLASVWQRFIQSFKGPAPTNPRMVHYLAAGSVHGLRPLRYEKRVARNRFIGLFLLLVLILVGLARVYFP